MPEDDLLPKSKKEKEYLIYGAIGVAVILIAAFIQRKTNLNGATATSTPISAAPASVATGSTPAAPDLSGVTSAISTIQSTMVENQQNNQDNLKALQSTMLDNQQTNQTSLTTLVTQLQTNEQNALSQIQSNEQTNLSTITNLFNSQKTNVSPVQQAASNLPISQSGYNYAGYVPPVIPLTAPTVVSRINNPNDTSLAYGNSVPLMTSTPHVTTQADVANVVGTSVGPHGDGLVTVRTSNGSSTVLAGSVFDPTSPNYKPGL